jgi:hypothetical protein
MSSLIGYWVAIAQSCLPPLNGWAGWMLLGNWCCFEGGVRPDNREQSGEILAQTTGEEEWPAICMLQLSNKRS